MQLKLTRSLKNKLKAVVSGLFLDILDGDVDEVGTLVESLRTLATELETQNAKSNPSQER